MTEIKYTIVYCVFVKTFVIFYYGSGTVINYLSGSTFLTSDGSRYGYGSTRQNVTIPTVPVPQHWTPLSIETIDTRHRKTIDTICRKNFRRPFPFLFSIKRKF